MKERVMEPVRKRIERHFKRGMGYYELAMLVYPPDQHPRAWRYQANGGPPGLVLTFSRVLHAMGFVWVGQGSSARLYRKESSVNGSK